jgi:hypothetical protein
MNIKRCPAFNCGYARSSMPEYKFCPMCGTLLQMPKKTLYDKGLLKKQTNSDGVGFIGIVDCLEIKDVKEALKEYDLFIKKQFYWTLNDVNKLNKKAKEIFGAELVTPDEELLNE